MILSNIIPSQIHTFAAAVFQFFEIRRSIGQLSRRPFVKPLKARTLQQPLVYAYIYRRRIVPIYKFINLFCKIPDVISFVETYIVFRDGYFLPNKHTRCIHFIFTRLLLFVFYHFYWYLLSWNLSSYICDLFSATFRFRVCSYSFHARME